MNTPNSSANTSSLEARLRRALLYFIDIAGLFMLVVFGFESLAQKVPVQAVADFSLAGVMVLATLILRFTPWFKLASYLSLFSGGLLFLWLSWSGGIQNSGILWSYTYPIFAIFILGMGPGSIVSATFLLLFSAILLIPGFSPGGFVLPFIARAIAVYALILICTIFYEQARRSKDKAIAELTMRLEGERNEMEAMKDNIDDAIFLLDSDFRIQAQYSQAMEKILGLGDLAGMNFLELAGGNLRERERQALGDYFDMVYKGAFDKVMLADINPLQDFSYLLPMTKEERFLSCSLSRLEGGDRPTMILGTLKDQTERRILESQLKAEEGKRADEMKSLFEIIHVEPQVLNDFIEDAEAEFDHINECLKDQARSSRDVMVDVYQCIHAIKSNAVILGLDSLGSKVHSLEQKVSSFREKENLAFQDMLHVTLSIEQIQREKDRLKELIAKIVGFRYGQGRMQEEFVLVQTLERVIDKVGHDRGKKAQILVDKMDAQALSGPYRRLVKEILVQLVRNAMYHGIETPDLRESLGKPATGMLRLKIERSGELLVLELSDDGQGLNFKTIREKAERAGVLAGVGNERNAMLQAIFSPGFSTAEEADLHAGRGVGLSMVRDRVKKAGGTIKVHSEEGKGVTFRISLPELLD